MYMFSSALHFRGITKNGTRKTVGFCRPVTLNLWSLNGLWVLSLAGCQTRLGTKPPLRPSGEQGGKLAEWASAVNFLMCQPGSKYLRLVVTCQNCLLNSQTCLGRRLEHKSVFGSSSSKSCLKETDKNLIILICRNSSGTVGLSCNDSKEK